LKPGRPKTVTTPPPLAEALRFMQVLWALAHGLESTSKRMRVTVGVTGPQRLVLRLVGHYDRPSPSDLANALHVHPSSLTGVLKRLEKAGLLRRTRDPSDGRRAGLTLTARGAALNARRSGTVEASVRRVLDNVPRARALAAQTVLTALARELGVEPGAAAELGPKRR
jgi:DNA-binding MarR family transcriptional regulator